MDLDALMTVNLNDPKAVRDKYAELGSLIKQLTNARDKLGLLVGSEGQRPRRVVRRSGGREAKLKASPPPAQKRVIDVVERHARPMRTVEVAERLGVASDADEKNRIGAALYAAASANRLTKVGTLYAPRDWKPEQASLPTGGGSEE